MSWFKSFFLYLANFTSYAQILEFIRPSFMYIVYHIFDSTSTRNRIYVRFLSKKNCPFIYAFIYANGQFNTFIQQYHFRIRLDLSISSRHLKNRGFPLVILNFFTSAASFIHSINSYISFFLLFSYTTINYNIILTLLWLAIYH